MTRRDAVKATAATALIGAAFSRPAGAQSVATSPMQPLTAPRHGPVLVAVVVGNGATVIDFAGPWEVFQDATVPPTGASAQNDSPFSLAMISDKTGPLEATSGMIVTPRYAFDDPHLPQPNVIVMGAQGEHTAKKLAWIERASANAEVVMSVCTGAFLLAQTGLLDGLKATTHHDFYDAFEAKFPKVELVRGPRYVENPGSKFCTAGGLTSGIELALRVVQRYYGVAAVNRTAYYMEYNRSPNRPSQA